MTQDLFASDEPSTTPLAERMRPQDLSQVVGQEHLTNAGGILDIHRSTRSSLIFWGPPGSGKTTLASLLGGLRSGTRFVRLSAVSAGVADVRKVVEAAKTQKKLGSETVLFLDEIHRFNKAQQDALLPHVESGLLLLYGATTENPSFHINAALLSRARVVTTKTLDAESLSLLAKRALEDKERGLGEQSLEIDPEAMALLVRVADGDARTLHNVLELAASLATNQKRKSIPSEAIREAAQTTLPRYDRSGEEHFNLISAMQKSIRASDPQGAVYWVERMLQSGEDPLYLARRLVRTASEDIGLADPDALPQAIAAWQTVRFLGLPEAGIALHQCALYLALAPKSNRVERAQIEAAKTIESTGSLSVPMAFRNAPTELMKKMGYGEGYKDDHNHPEGISGQSGLPEEIREAEFYRPGDKGFEAELRKRWQSIQAFRNRKSSPETEDR